MVRVGVKVAVKMVVEVQAVVDKVAGWEVAVMVAAMPVGLTVEGVMGTEGKVAVPRVGMWAVEEMVVGVMVEGVMVVGVMVEEVTVLGAEPCLQWGWTVVRLPQSP